MSGTVCGVINNFQEQWNLRFYRATSVSYSLTVLLSDCLTVLYFTKAKDSPPPAPVSGQANWLLVIPN